MSEVENGRHQLAKTLGTVARDLEAQPSENQTLEGIVRAAVTTVPGVSEGGITQVNRNGDVSVRTPTDERVAQCDKLQQELREGPCLNAIWQQHTVIINEMSSDARWPRFTARAAELGFGSLISFRLFIRDDSLGALNLYSAAGEHLNNEAEIIGEVFATHAAIALAGARHHRQMNEALASRDMIGQAKGLLMQRENVTGQQAFDMLVRASQASNIKLTDVAAWLIDEHENPGEEHRPPKA